MWVALAKLGWSQTDLQRRMVGRRRVDGSVEPLTSGLISRWMHGERMPSGEMMVQLERILRVPFTAWTRPPARRFIPPGASRTGTDG